MTKIRLKILFYEAKVIYVLFKVFAYIADKFADRHHRIFVKYCRIKGVEE